MNMTNIYGSVWNTLKTYVTATATYTQERAFCNFFELFCQENGIWLDINGKEIKNQDLLPLKNYCGAISRKDRKWKSLRCEKKNFYVCQYNIYPNRTSNFNRRSICKGFVFCTHWKCQWVPVFDFLFCKCRV